MSGYAVRNDGQGWRSVESPDDVKDNEWFEENSPPDPVPLPRTQLELLNDASSKRDEYLAVAAIRIAPLQDAVDLGDATDSDVDLLKKWKQYRVALSRIDQQENYPFTIEWPVTPGEPV